MYYPFGYAHYLERKRKSEGEGGLAAQMKAEEQALIAGMRAVPKAERHRLRGNIRGVMRISTGGFVWYPKK